MKHVFLFLLFITHSLYAQVEVQGQALYDLHPEGKLIFHKQMVEVGYDEIKYPFQQQQQQYGGSYFCRETHHDKRRIKYGEKFNVKETLDAGGFISARNGKVIFSLDNGKIESYLKSLSSSQTVTLKCTSRTYTKSFENSYQGGSSYEYYTHPVCMNLCEENLLDSCEQRCQRMRTFPEFKCPEVDSTIVYSQDICTIQVAE